MASNPVSLPIPGETTGTITAAANASNYQVVTLSWQISEQSYSVQFTGSGENVQMTTPWGETSYILPTAKQGYQISAYFQYSTTGPNGQLYEASVSDPITTQSDGTTTIQVTSEDSTDNDYNDTYLTIVAEPI